MNNLYLGVCLAPYRIDFCNYLYDNCNFVIYHQYRNLGKNYNMDEICGKCKFDERYLNIGKIFDRRYSVGIKQLIDKYNPNVIIVPEFSLITIQVIMIKTLLNYKFKVISLCDDSYDMICGDDFSKAHKLARKIVPYFLDNLILDNNKTVEWYQKKLEKASISRLLLMR